MSQESLYRGEVSEGLCDAVLAVASAAKGHLDEARRLAPGVPPEARPLFLGSLAAESYLADLEAANFNPFDPSLAAPTRPLRHALLVKWSLLRGTY